MNREVKAGSDRTFSNAIVVFFVLMSFGVITNLFSGTTDFSKPQAPGIVGQRGYIISEMVACPEVSDLRTLDKEFFSAENANDMVGLNDVLDKAIANGCRSLSPGQSGLVINMSGYFFGWTQLRLDDDEQTYWIENRYVGTMTAPSWDIGRLLWSVVDLTPAKIRVAVELN